MLSPIIPRRVSNASGPLWEKEPVDPVIPCRIQGPVLLMSIRFDPSSGNESAWISSEYTSMDLLDQLCTHSGNTSAPTQLLSGSAVTSKGNRLPPLMSGIPSLCMCAPDVSVKFPALWSGRVGTMIPSALLNLSRAILRHEQERERHLQM